MVHRLSHFLDHRFRHRRRRRLVIALALASHAANARMQAATTPVAAPAKA